MSLPTVAVAGGTGNLGSKIVRELLSPSQRPRFSDVIVLARASSALTHEYESLGALVRVYSEDSLETSLADVDVLINTVGPAGHHFKNLLVDALSRSSVRLYFPSEFGVDHYTHDFVHEEWGAKKKHFLLLEKLKDTGIRICRVYAGLFLEDSIGPWFGFYNKKSLFEAVGSMNQATSYTSMSDVGRALAVLSTLPVSEVPAQVHLSGDSKSMADIARIMEKEREAAGPIRVEEIALEPYKAEVLANPLPTPEKYLRFLMGEGKIDHTETAMGNDNALIEKDSGFGRWRSMEDLAAETKGLPWPDYD